MNLTCSKCNHTYEFSDSLVFKQGPVFTYVKCASCEKIATIKNEFLGKPQASADQQQANAFASRSAAAAPDKFTEHKPANDIAEDRKKEPMSQSYNPQAAGIPLTITQAVRQQLFDLGYNKDDIYVMTPERAHEIIRHNITKPAAARPAATMPEQHECPGWLIVHDESVRLQTFDLKEGTNIVGRKATSATVDIAIETDDMTMSRRHCKIEVVLNERRGDHDFIISDLNALNGIILNSRIQRRLSDRDEIYLNDGDTFQLGLTKIVFKRNHEMRRKEAVVREVANQPYEPTVVISKDQVQQIFKNV